MRQVAAVAGVSAKTVSRVLRNDRYVSDEVRLRVERAVAELQYVPNVLARTFRSGSDNAIGVAVPDISDPFFAALTHAVETVAQARGSAVIVTSLGDDDAGERRRARGAARPAAGRADRDADLAGPVVPGALAGPDWRSSSSTARRGGSRPTA